MPQYNSTLRPKMADFSVSNDILPGARDREREKKNIHSTVFQNLVDLTKIDVSFSCVLLLIMNFAITLSK